MSDRELMAAVLGYYAKRLNPADAPEAVRYLERYQRFMYYSQNERGQRRSFRVQGTRLQSLRTFFRWLVRERVIEMSPAELLELPRL